jgi:hypothetical protein
MEELKIEIDNFVQEVSEMVDILYISVVKCEESNHVKLHFLYNFDTEKIDPTLDFVPKYPVTIKCSKSPEEVKSALIDLYPEYLI